MSDLLTELSTGAYLLPLLLVALLLLYLLIYRRRRRQGRSVDQVVRSIGYDYLSNLIIPNADEGEIHIDHLILTTEGLLVIDVKEASGTVFGSDKMQDWTVISSDRRFTFANPQPALFDRIAAIRQIVKQVPVTGRILFPNEADFSKGVPGLVCKLDDLVSEFGETDKLAAQAKIEAFKPHWELITAQSRPAEPLREGRGSSID